MKILIEDIPAEGLDLDIEEKLSLENLSLVSPVVAHLELHKSSYEIIINGRLITQTELQCSRCLKTFNGEMDVLVNVVYHPIEELGHEKHELRGDEMDMGFYSSTELDLRDILKEQVLLNIQMKPLCDDNCRGICPKCGNDLNTDRCYCETKETDPRLEILKNLMEKRRE